MATPTSYLQTLSKTDAIAFATSLQKVQAHLSDELKWMTAQLQQKTMQLEGVEALLSEAVSLGLIDASDVITTSNSEASVVPETKAAQNSMPVISDHSEISSSKVSTSSDTADDELSLPELTTEAASVTPLVESIQASTDAIALQPRRRGRRAAAKTKQAAAKAKPQKSSTRAAKKGKSAEGAELGQFLRTEFQDKTLMNAIAQVLDQSPKPLETDEIMAALYSGLSDEDSKRAKRSLANLLSLGKSKGKWRSASRGLYASN